VVLLLVTDIATSIGAAISSSTATLPFAAAIASDAPATSTAPVTTAPTHPAVPITTAAPTAAPSPPVSMATVTDRAWCQFLQEAEKCALLSDETAPFDLEETDDYPLARNIADRAWCQFLQEAEKCALLSDETAPFDLEETDDYPLARNIADRAWCQFLQEAEKCAFLSDETAPFDLEDESGDEMDMAMDVDNDEVVTSVFTDNRDLRPVFTICVVGSSTRRAAFRKARKARGSAARRHILQV
ncbi:hypothetical protein FB645_002959, partial [Coemansia sp. IMI 203386]